MADTKDNVIVLGKQRMPDGGILVIPNFLSFHDLLLLERQLAPRSITYLIDEHAVFDPLLQSHLEKEGVSQFEFAADEDHVESFRRQLHSHVAQGQAVVYVPGQAATRAGAMTSIPSAKLRFLLDAQAPVIPLFIDHPEETRLAIEDVGDVPNVVFAFGKVMEREAANVPNFLEDLLLAGRDAFQARPALEMNLAYALLLGLKKHATVHRIHDGASEKDLRFDRLLASAIVFSKLIRKSTSKPRVGIVLPPGLGGLLANIATIFAGKIPVNLNFTAGAASITSCIKQADLDCFLTAGPFIQNFEKFPWPPKEQLILLEEKLPALKKKIAGWLVLSKMLGARALASMVGISRKGGEQEAVLLFTSGSSGEPKGVVLTHRNVMANINQFSSRLQLRSHDSALGCLPLFHSFGCTVTMWYPVIEGVDIVTYHSPLKPDKLAELIEKHGITLMVATPTFLRGYLRKAKREQLASLKLVVTGAEKLPLKVAEEFEKKFGKPVLEGYGLTETSPVSNVNLPDPESTSARVPVLATYRLGSVGQLIPGMAVRITDPDTDQPLPLNKSGMIWLNGPNVFTGYLNQPEKTRDMIVNQWLRTGDIGRMDEDGFLYIEGRLSRFSKIAGEMVPHETLEEAINRELGVDGDAERKIAVMGVRDDAKGEVIVLLTTIQNVDATDLRYRLLEKGIASLWIPKDIIIIREIPHLASGKLDLKRCRDIAEKGSETDVEE